MEAASTPSASFPEPIEAAPCWFSRPSRKARRGLDRFGEGRGRSRQRGRRDQATASIAHVSSSMRTPISILSMQTSAPDAGCTLSDRSITSPGRRAPRRSGTAAVPGSGTVDPDSARQPGPPVLRSARHRRPSSCGAAHHVHPPGGTGAQRRRRGSLIRAHRTLPSIRTASAIVGPARISDMGRKAASADRSRPCARGMSDRPPRSNTASDPRKFTTGPHAGSPGAIQSSITYGGVSESTMRGSGAGG